MPEINFELKDRIHQLMEDKHITPGEARVLKVLLSNLTRKEAARRLNITNPSLDSMISKLVKQGVLIRVSRGVLQLTDDVNTIHRPEPDTPPPPPKEVPLVISAAERKWMLKNYDSNNRSAAAKKLGRSKYDICRMAIALGLDRK